MASGVETQSAQFCKILPPEVTAENIANFTEYCIDLYIKDIIFSKDQCEYFADYFNAFFIDELKSSDACQQKN